MYKVVYAKNISVILAFAAAVIFLLADIITTTVGGNKALGDEQIRAFLSQNGINVTENSPDVREIYIPETFNEVYTEYNNIQKMSGYNMEAYKGKNVVKYTYTFMNEQKELSFVNVLVYKNRIIGGDITAPGQNGTLQPLF